MATTPGTSRSGRVLKKSVRLLDMESDYKSTPNRPSAAKSATTCTPSTPFNGDTSLQSVHASPIKTELVNGNMATTPTTESSGKNANNLKIKLNFSGDLKKENFNSEFKINLNSSGTSATTTAVVATAAAKNLIRVPSDIKQYPNAFILKVKKEDDISLSNIGALKRSSESSSSLNPVKVWKTDSESKSLNEKILEIVKSNNTMTTPIKIELPKASQTGIKSETAESTKNNNQAVFKSAISPIGLQRDSTTKDTITKIVQQQQQQPFSSSTPKVSTVIAKSIQEQKRINQRAKMLSQQQSPAPAPIPMTIRSSAGGNAGTHSSSNTSFSFQSPRSTRNNSEDSEKNKGKAAVSSYVLWCREARPDIQARYPDLGFVDLSRKMGQIWHSLAQTEKNNWFRKAEILTLNSEGNRGNLYMQDWISDDLKPRSVSSNQTIPITTDTLDTFDDNFLRGDREAQLGNEIHKIGVDLIDVQGYLNILGDSLETIGSYLQRGVKYNSQIDYCKSTALSTLLDTALVAMGTLPCLTRAVPAIAPDDEQLTRTLESVTYFMPPPNPSYDA